MTDHTDRELLKLAAKAADIGPIVCYVTDGNYLRIGYRNAYHIWRPLSDDGDALRLLAALSIGVMWHRDGRVEAFRGDPASPVVCESSRENRQGNLRRAIVRAAAMLGKKLDREKTNE